MATIHWSTVGDGKPPDIPQKVWENMPDELKAKIRAQGQSEAKLDAEEDSVFQQRQDNVNNFLYGSDYEQEQTWAHNQQLDQLAVALGGQPGSEINRNGQPLIEPMQQPGALAAANRADAEALAQQRAFVDDLISRNGRITGDLSSAFDRANAADQATLAQLRSDFNSIGLDPWEAIPSSAAAQAYADPASIAAQNQALDMLFGAANGSMDAHSNPQDVANQQRALNMLFGAAGGSLDAHTNPEDLARQIQAADKLWALSDPEVTAQEKFIYEKARLKEEQDRRAAMDASLRNLSARGQLGSGHEIGAMLGAQQTTSQNRLLSDLGAQANAIARSMDALGGYTNLATNMRNASDAMTSGNMNRRLGGMQGAATQSSNMRNASDAMAQGNMNRRLSATGAAGNLASNMRDSSFNEAYARGRATDTINMANQASRQQWNFANANLESGQAQALANAGFGVNGAMAGRAGNLAGVQLGASNQQFGAQSGVTNLGRDISNDTFMRGWMGVQAQNQSLGDQIWLDESRRFKTTLDEDDGGWF